MLLLLWSRSAWYLCKRLSQDSSLGYRMTILALLPVVLISDLTALLKRNWTWLSRVPDTIHFCLPCTLVENLQGKVLFLVAQLFEWWQYNDVIFPGHFFSTTRAPHAASSGLVASPNPIAAIPFARASGKDYFRTTIFFPANFVTLLAVIWLDGEHYFSAGTYTPNNIKL